MERDEMMLKAAAFKTLARAAFNAEKQEELELRGFLALFHPELTTQEVNKLASSRRQ